jgi:hypothetical protein
MTSLADGRLLRLLAVQGFVVSVWLLTAEGRGWELEVVIPMERRFRTLCPEIAPGPVVLKFVSSGERSALQIEIGSVERMLVSAASAALHTSPG